MQTQNLSENLSPPWRGEVPTLAPPVRRLYANYQIIHRNGAVVAFEPAKIAVA